MANGNSRDEFVVVHRFVIEGLGLRGASLLVYAGIYGFCEKSNRDFYESKPKTAEFLGLSERTVFQSIKELIAKGLINEVGSHELGGEEAPRCIASCGRLPQRPSPKRLGTRVPSDDPQSQSTAMPMTQSGTPLKDLHLRFLQGAFLPMKKIHAVGQRPMKRFQVVARCPMKKPPCRPLREVHPIRKSENKELIGEDL